MPPLVVSAPRESRHYSVRAGHDILSFRAVEGAYFMNEQFMVDMFAAADSRDIPRFLRYLTDDVAFRFANAPTLHGHAQVTEALTTLFQTVGKLRHTMVGVHSCGGVWAVETVVHFEDRHGRSFSVPACSLMVLGDDRVRDYKIFMDNSQMFLPPEAS